MFKKLAILLVTACGLSAAQPVQHFDTVPDMVAGAAPAAGDVAIVAGRTAIGDGGGGTFIGQAGIAAVSTNLGTIHAKTNADAIKWKRDYSERVDFLWFGAKGDGTTDETALLRSALSLEEPIYLPPGEYYISGSAAFVQTNVVLIGSPDRPSVITSKYAGVADNYSLFSHTRLRKLVVDNVDFRETRAIVSHPTLSLKHALRVEFADCTFTNITDGVVTRPFAGEKSVVTDGKVDFLMDGCVAHCDPGVANNMRMGIFDGSTYNATRIELRNTETQGLSMAFNLAPSTSGGSVWDSATAKGCRFMNSASLARNVRIIFSWANQTLVEDCLFQGMTIGDPTKALYGHCTYMGKSAVIRNCRFVDVTGWRGIQALPGYDKETPYKTIDSHSGAPTLVEGCEFITTSVGLANGNTCTGWSSMQSAETTFRDCIWSGAVIHKVGAAVKPLIQLATSAGKQLSLRIEDCRFYNITSRYLVMVTSLSPSSVFVFAGNRVVGSVKPPGGAGILLYFATDPVGVVDIYDNRFSVPQYFLSVASGSGADTFRVENNAIIGSGGGYCFDLSNTGTKRLYVGNNYIENFVTAFYWRAKPLSGIVTGNLLSGVTTPVGRAAGTDERDVVLYADNSWDRAITTLDSSSQPFAGVDGSLGLGGTQPSVHRAGSWVDLADVTQLARTSTNSVLNLANSGIASFTSTNVWVADANAVFSYWPPTLATNTIAAGYWDDNAGIGASTAGTAGADRRVLTGALGLVRHSVVPTGKTYTLNWTGTASIATNWFVSATWSGITWNTAASSNIVANTPANYSVTFNAGAANSVLIGIRGAVADWFEIDNVELLTPSPPKVADGVTIFDAADGGSWAKAPAAATGPATPDTAADLLALAPPPADGDTAAVKGLVTKTDGLGGTFEARTGQTATGTNAYNVLASANADDLKWFRLGGPLTRFGTGGVFEVNADGTAAGWRRLLAYQDGPAAPAAASGAGTVYQRTADGQLWVNSDGTAAGWRRVQIARDGPGDPAGIAAAGSLYQDSANGRRWVNVDGTATGWQELAYRSDIPTVGGGTNLISVSREIVTNETFSVSWPIASLPSISSQSLDMTVTNLLADDAVVVSTTNSLPNGVVVTGQAIGTNKITLTALNLTGDIFGATNLYKVRIVRDRLGAGGLGVGGGAIYSATRPTDAPDYTVWINSANRIPYVLTNKTWYGFGGVTLTEPLAADRYTGCLWYDGGNLWMWNGASWTQIN